MNDAVACGTLGRPAVLIAVTSSTNGRSAGDQARGRKRGTRVGSMVHRQWARELDHKSSSAFWTSRASGGLSSTVAHCVPETGVSKDGREEALPVKISVETAAAVEVGYVPPVPIVRGAGRRSQSEGAPRVWMNSLQLEEFVPDITFDALFHDLAPKHRRVTGYRHRSGCG
ncbi:MAG TPA: hypothetical protein P5300_11580 [Acidobacteriota bacterium]|nr:hypothetical protein [Acidobacteriota bacterium]